MDREISLKLRTLLLSSTTILREAESGNFPSYMRERIFRLQALLKKMESAGYDPKKYHPLYRQLAKILDTNISDYFSPAIDAGIDRMVKASRYGSQITERGIDNNTERDRYILYTLGKTGLSIYGRLVKKIGRIGFDRAKERMAEDGVSFLYPDSGGGFSKEIERGLLVYAVSGSNPGRRGALYIERIVQKLSDAIIIKDPSDAAARELSDGAIRGRIRFEGKYYYLLDF
jgi:hypothetical protein